MTMHAEIQKLIRILTTLADAHASDIKSVTLGLWHTGYHQGAETAYRTAISHLKQTEERISSQGGLPCP